MFKDTGKREKKLIVAWWVIFLIAIISLIAGYSMVTLMGAIIMLLTTCTSDIVGAIEDQTKAIKELNKKEDKVEEFV